MSSEQSKAWALANPHKMQANTHMRTIAEMYPEAFKNTDMTTASLADWLLEHRGQPCRYCKAKAYHIDHIKPLSRGGEHRFSNIQMICEDCNKAKTNKPEEEFRQWVSTLQVLGVNKNRDSGNFLNFLLSKT